MDDPGKTPASSGPQGINRSEYYFYFDVKRGIFPELRAVVGVYWGYFGFNDPVRLYDCWTSLAHCGVCRTFLRSYSLAYVEWFILTV